jgi:hypothetical protein
MIDDSSPLHSLIVRFEPFLNRAVDFAIGEGLIKRTGGNRIELTNLGKSLAGELKNAEGAFAAEKQFMHAVGQAVTEKFVNEMFGKGTK